VVQWVSITTESGVIGISPGTKVVQVNAGPPLRVTDGENQFQVLPYQVTNDLDVASAVFRAQQMDQTQIDALRTQQMQEENAQQQADLAKQTQNMVAAQRKIQASSAAQPTVNPLDLPAHRVFVLPQGESGPPPRASY
jgi:hypothetical protein